MKLNIRNKLFIGFTLLVLLASLIEAFAFIVTREYIVSQIDQKQTQEAQNAAKEIQDFFIDINHHGIALSKFYAKDIEASISARTDIEPFAQYILMSNSEIKKITLLSPNGQALDSFGSSETTASDTVETTSTPFKLALSGKTTVSNIAYAEKNTSPSVMFFTPIVVDNKILGVIKIDLNLETVQQKLRESKLNLQGYVYLVDEKGRLIDHPKDNFLLKHPDLSSRNIIKDALTNKQLEAARGWYTNEDNILVMAKSIKIPEYNWVVVFEQPVAEAYQFLDFIRNVFFAILIGSLVFLLLIALFLSENLTRPIRKLQQAAEQIEKGKMDTPIIVKSGDEIESLSHSFASMVNQLLQRETAIRKENQEIAVLLQSLTDAVIGIDANNTILVFNKAATKITGLESTSVFGKNIDDILHFYSGQQRISFGEYNDQSETMIQKLKEKGLSMSNSRGEKITVSLATSPIITEGKRTGAIITFHDITREHELEEMKLDFVSMSAHELRTPLTAIRGYGSLLQSQQIKNLDNSGKELLKRLMASTDNLGNLIDNLLSVSRIEQARFNIDTKPIDLSGIIKKVIDDVRQTATAREQKIIVNLPDEFPITIADPFRIGQVVLNLLSNAMSFSPNGATITVRVEKKGGFLEFSIHDTGQGIPKEALPKLFSKFFRVSGQLEQGSKGTGLGLFISKSIIELHQGKIWVESEVGRGSTFTFNLQIATPEAIIQYKKSTPQPDLTLKQRQGIILKKP